jgi:hypothetical protein
MQQGADQLFCKNIKIFSYVPDPEKPLRRI